jgi:site-specific DNA-methyltransferase (adenine-specific)
MKFELHHGDCLDVLKTLADCSVDAIVTDPPAGIAFMGKEWDRDKGGKADWIQWMQSVADQCLRVIKPGGHALVWAIPRTSHWTGTAWEDAGWQPRDKIYHIFGSGFPKSLDISKAIDKMAGAEREVVGVSSVTGAQRSQTMNDGNKGTRRTYQNDEPVINNLTAPATQAAKQWEGWGTALKPAAEEWWLFRKPLIGTVAANVLEHGTGGLNVDGCRIEANGDKLGGGRISTTTDGWDRPWKHDSEAVEACKARGNEAVAKAEQLGRFPANFIHDGSEEVLALFPETGPAKAASRGLQHSGRHGGFADIGGNIKEGTDSVRGHDDDGGSAARFFYCAKASRDDRDEGCGALELTEAGIENDSGRGFSESDPMAAVMRHNPHPTVKPTDLMRYLCRLITPPGGIVLDPFTGSGSTGKAAMAEGFRFIGIEREAEYIEIARARISAEAEKPRQLSLF